MNNKKRWLAIGAMVLPITLLTYCTKNNQVLNTGGNNTNTTVSTTLLSQKTTSAPVIDGTIDMIWQNATKLQFSTVVPDPGNQLWAGFIGETHNVTMQSMYDDSYIYFLVQWDDPTQSVTPRTWYYNPGTKQWARENNSPTFDVNGVQTRGAFGEDKIAFLWNINNSTPGFATQTCYASCHLNVTYMDTIQPTGGYMATNNIDEKLDQWEMKLMENQAGGLGQLTDGYQDWGGGHLNANGRHTDPLNALTDGPIANSQNLVRIGDTAKNAAKYAVPKWVNLTAINYNHLMATDTTLSNVVKITGVDTNGVLYYAGGTIDPRTSTDYQQVGSGDGPRAIPYYILSPLTGGAADVTAQAVYTGSGWIVEIKRLLKTNDVLLQDVDFSSLKDQPFAVGIFNNCGNAHGVGANFLLKFNK